MKKKVTEYRGYIREDSDRELMPLKNSDMSLMIDLKRHLSVKHLLNLLTVRFQIPKRPNFMGDSSRFITGSNCLM